jgi:hypothetical protein
MLRDKDLFVSGWDESTITPEEIAQVEQPEGTDLTIPEMPAPANADGLEVEAPTVETPAETVPETTPEAPATTEEAPAEGDKSITEILNELDAIWASQEKKETEIQKTTEELSKEVQADPALTEMVDKLQRQITERDAESRKKDITIDFLQEQIETLYKENVANKYGRVDEDGVMNLINTDSNLKSIISQTIKSQDNPAEKTKLVDLYKSQLETLTGFDFTDFIDQQKNKAENELSDEWNDVSTSISTWVDWESMFV